MAGDHAEAGSGLAGAIGPRAAPTNPAWFHNLLAHPETTVLLEPR
jgi:hypothetical protein